jgi:hypothetical protein
VYFSHKNTAVVVIHVLASGTMSGMALNACQAIIKNRAEIRIKVCMVSICCHAMIRQNGIPNKYNTLNIPSRNGMAFARIGSAL